MSYAERKSWSTLLATLVGLIVYLVLIVPQLTTTAVGAIDWFWPMLWTITGAIVLSIVISIVWGIIAGARNPHERALEDVRDTDIAWLGSRIGQAFLVIAMVGGLILCALRTDWFWVANTLYLGFAISGIADGVTRAVAYRVGMP